MIPQNITIMSQVVQVQWRDDLMAKENCHGQCLFDRNIIVLQTPNYINELTQNQTELTFRHEVVHFCLHYLGYDALNDDESFVDSFANVLYQAEKTAYYLD